MIVNVTVPLEEQVIYARVTIRGAVSVWSATSSPWTAAGTCGNYQYLDDRWPKVDNAEALSPRVASRLDKDPTRWGCLPCPEGASCTGDGVTWQQVKALFGWWREHDIGRSNFTRCIYAPACKGAENPELSARWVNETSGEDPALVPGQLEGCAVELGHLSMCSEGEERCRLCGTCREGYQKNSVKCSECPATQSNRGLLALGFLLVIFAAGILVYIQIENQGRGGLSDAVKKVLLNYMQVASLASGFPLEWPAVLDSLFEFQSTISTCGQYLLRPDCEMSHLDPATAFYYKMLMYAMLPVGTVIFTIIFWVVFAKCRHPVCAVETLKTTWCCVPCRVCSCFTCYYKRKFDTRAFCGKGPIAWRARSDAGYSPKDKMVLTIVLMLYMIYPTVLQQNFSMLACRRVADEIYLDADMQEICGEGRHLNWVLAVCIPQLLLYVLGLPVLAVLFLRRNRKTLLTNRVAMFRYGLLYNGYSPKRYYWEGMMAVRKASMVALGVFGGISGVEMQAHVGSALLVLFLIFHLAASPYDTSRSTRHKVLHNMDTAALVLCWTTLWGETLRKRFPPSPPPLLQQQRALTLAALVRMAIIV